MKLLFVGEKRSQLAIKMGVTWKDKRLAASHLYKAITSIGINWDDCEFINLFEDNAYYIDYMLEEYEGRIIAMGRKVERELKRMDIPHYFIYHPATRGALRKISQYKLHVLTQLYCIL